MTGELGRERLAARRPRELRGDERPLELKTGRERFLHEPNALHDRETAPPARLAALRSEEHTSELQSLTNLVCRLLLEKKKEGRNHRIRDHRLARPRRQQPR